MHIEQYVPLRDWTTFRIGGLSDFFTQVSNEDELKEALLFARKKKIPVHILGGGSNIVFPDRGYPGLVIRLNIKGVVFRSISRNEVLLEVGAGEIWDELVSFVVSQGLYGIENLSGIPGTVGAAPIQNIGAYGMELETQIEWVDAISKETGVKKRFSCTQCNFGYRESFFKTVGGKEYIIVRVCMSASKSGAPNLSYPDVSAYFKENNSPTLFDVREAILKIRKKKFPDISRVGTAGSFFKNPIVSNGELRRLKEMFPHLPSFFHSQSHAKIPLGYILEMLGWKGKRINNVGTHEHQSLVVVNYGNATQEELSAFAQIIEDDVRKKTGINLEREVSFVM